MGNKININNTKPAEKPPWEMTREEYLSQRMDKEITVIKPDGIKIISEYKPYINSLIAKGAKSVPSVPRDEGVFWEYNIPKIKIKIRLVPVQKVKPGHELQHKPSQKTLQEYTDERIGFSEDPIITTKDFHVLDGNGRLANRIYRGDKLVDAIVLPITNAQYKKLSSQTSDLNGALAYIAYKRGGYGKRIDFMNKSGQPLGNIDFAFEVLRHKKWENMETIAIREIGEHQKEIARAIKEGHPVPAKVLAEYSELRGKKLEMRGKRRLKKLIYTDYKGEKQLKASSYIEYKGYKIVKEHARAYNIVDPSNKTVGVYAGPRGALDFIDTLAKQGPND